MARGGRARLGITAGLAALAAAACQAPAPHGAAPEPSTDGSACTSGWDEAVLWSSQEDAQTKLDLWRAGAPSGHMVVGARGVAPAPNGVSGVEAGRGFAVATGDATKDRTTVLAAAVGGCSVEARPLKQQLVEGAVQADMSFYTAATVGGDTRIVRSPLLSPRGTTEAVATGVTAWALTSDGRRLYALGATPNGSARLDVFDIATMRLVRSVRLDGAADVGPQALVHDGRLYYAQTLVTPDVQGSSIGVVDLTTWRQSSIDLGHASPYLLRLDGDRLFVAHTFINPTFGEMSTYRTVSVVDLRTRAVRALDVGPGLRDLAVGRGRLVVITGKDDDHLQLRHFDARTLRPQETRNLTRPPGQNYQPAGLWITSG